METTSKKRDRYDALMLFGISVALLAVVVCTLARGYRYGSVIDWQSQHSVLPDVFRKHFYETGNLIPEFLPEVGAGQNAYNFSYYGMLNPLIFPSYLMPFVSMVTYVEALSVLILLSMAWLFYGWLRHMQAHADVLGTVVSDRAIRLATCLFAFASPFLYHSHKQFVFISYIPFLLLALIGVDRWFLKRRGLLLASMVTALFLTSYLHAVAAVVAVSVYAVYRWWTMRERCTAVNGGTASAGASESTDKIPGTGVPGFFAAAIRYVGLVTAGAAAAGVLLIPTGIAVLAGRTSGNTPKESLLSLLIPKFPIHEVFYSGYGLGMTAIVLFAALAIVFWPRSRAERFLSAAFLLVCFWPVTRYLLNGFLYSRGKALIPFTAIAAFLVALWFDRAFAGDATKNAKKPVHWFIYLIVPTAAILCALWTGFLPESLGFAAEWMVIPFLLFGGRRKSPWIFTAPLVAVAVVASVRYSVGDVFLERTVASRLHSPAKEALFAEAYDADPEASASAFRSDDISSPQYAANAVYDGRYHTTGFYSSVYSRAYLDMVYGDLRLANPAVNDISVSPQADWTFQTLMGVRYVLAEDVADTAANVMKAKLPAGYVPVASRDGFTVARSEDAYALAFLPDTCMSLRQYKTLTPAERRVALLRYAVVDRDLPDVDFAGCGAAPEYLWEITTFLTEPVEGSDGVTRVPMRGDNDSFLVLLKEPLNRYLYFVEMSVAEMGRHRTTVYVNGIKNSLSGRENARPNGNYNFLFAVTEQREERFLRIKLPEDMSVISPVKISGVSLEALRALRNHVTMATDLVWEKDGTLSGKINAGKAGTMCISVPYEGAFAAKVDGEDVPVLRVDGGLIGIDVTEGMHEFVLTYHAPGKKAGVACSLLGMLALAYVGLAPICRRKKKEQ